MDWKPFNHPQLGKVELGGWHPLIYANPLVATLGDIVTKTTDFILTHASAAPRLRIRRAEAMPLAKSLYKVTAEVSNEGYLATNVTAQGITNRRARQVMVELKIPKGAKVEVGRPKQVIGHLPGHSTLRKLEWVVRGRGPVTIIVSCPRAGRDEKGIAL
jgi:hypothetical protein